jgi:ankyrin repeat protein
MGNVDIVNYLIKMGVELNTQTFDGWLAIHFAVKQENVVMVELLVEQASVNINICTIHGLALNMAV